MQQRHTMLGRNPEIGFLLAPVDGFFGGVGGRGLCSGGRFWG